jgi:putative hydrolase
MEPVEALRRIAYLLEADRAPSYKVRAFRKAAAVVATIDSDQLRVMSPARLTDLDGVGDTTARVVTEALGGGVPDYLAHLEEESPGPPTGATAALRPRLVGDCHSHSDWSDGGSPVQEMAEAARDLGHDYLALTDHSPRLTVAHGLDRDRLRAQLDLVDELNEQLAPFRILTGIEVDILEDGTLDQDDDLLARLDVVVASVHSKLRMDEPLMTKRMLAAIESPHTDILGHCTGRIIVGRGRPPSTFDPGAVFEACARTGTAVEINSRPERLDPPDELLTGAVDAGCTFTIDSDAHAPGQFEWLKFGCAKAVDAGIPAQRIANTWHADRLLQWTAEHARA